MWPAVRRGLDFVLGLQLPFGGIAWSRRPAAGAGQRGRAAHRHRRASTRPLRAGIALAELLDDAQPDWELAVGRLGHALRGTGDLFLDKPRFSMDWYYPVLGGAVRGDAARDLLDSRWDDFVVPGLGVRCVDTEPLGHRRRDRASWRSRSTRSATADRATALLARHAAPARRTTAATGPATSCDDDAIWPVEHTTYTAAAVILAVDALAMTTPGADIFRGSSLALEHPALGLECGCEDTAARQPVS